MTLEQPPRRSFEDILAGLTELCPSQADLVAMSPGERIAALALSVAGLGAESSPEGQLELWWKVVCPERDSFPRVPFYADKRYFRFQAYTCGFFAGSHLRRAGARSKRIRLGEDGSYFPYPGETVVSDLVQFAIDQKAWVPGSSVPPLGAVTVIGTGTKTHVLTVVKPIEDDLVCTSGDGGQPGRVEDGEAMECSRICRRQLSRSGGKLYHGDREQLGFIDPEKIVAAAEPAWDLV